MPNDMDREFTEREERIRKRIVKRRRARRRLVTLITTLILLVAAGLGVLIYNASQNGNSISTILNEKFHLLDNAESEDKSADDKKTQAVVQVETEASVVETEAAVQTETSAPQTETNAPAADPNSVEGRYGLSSDENIKAAQIKALQYDYDAAITDLQAIEGAAGNAQIQQLISEYTAAKETLVPVDVTTVPHVFFHSLLNDDRGLREDLMGRDRAWRNDAAMTTTTEFDAMMQQMYDAGYVLISLNDMCIKTVQPNGDVTIEKNNNLMLPEGKKAFVMSEDDLSYYHTYGIGTQGYATKMVVDENGKPKCEYVNENGETLIGDYDVVPRLDTFIEEHPDFCYRGARGTVAMTGYNGVFGYRTNDYYKDINNENLDPDQRQWLEDHPDFNWDEDVAAAKAVADAMKAEGWTFASHTYGHLNATDSDLARLTRDQERWKTVNSPILGDTDIIIFAFGADIGGVGGYTEDNEKFNYYKKEGYNIFCNVDGHIGWTEWGDTFMRTGRVALDGFTMWQAMTEDAAVHSIYAQDYEILGISGIANFFNQYRITPIESE